MHPLKVLAEDRSQGRIRGIVSVCSAHSAVIRAALVQGQTTGGPVLIEATSNQVNQDGGYTGMTPAAFRRFVETIANEAGFALDKLILGGDHLGPNPWKAMVAEDALAKAEAMVGAFAAAGFSKLHLDASMGCAGEPEALDDATTAARAVRLAAAAEGAAAVANLPPPVYIIGTEVPTPGGATHALEGLKPTSAIAACKTIATNRRMFSEVGLGAAFARVIGLVVQPGVEFGHEDVIAYAPEKARDLVGVLEQEPDLIFEAHSTDYQSEARLADLVADGFAILKVGPSLTFAMREALYGLDMIAGTMDPAYGDRPLYRTMEGLMIAEAGNWRNYYSGSPTNQKILRHYSYSDRIRYYWPHGDAENAVVRLMESLADQSIPLPLISQFLPRSAAAVRDGHLVAKAEALVDHAIQLVLGEYARAARSM